MSAEIPIPDDFQAVMSAPCSDAEAVAEDVRSRFASQAAKWDGQLRFNAHQKAALAEQGKVNGALLENVKLTRSSIDSLLRITKRQAETAQRLADQLFFTTVALAVVGAVAAGAFILAVTK